MKKKKQQQKDRYSNIRKYIEELETEINKAKINILRSKKTADKKVWSILLKQRIAEKERMENYVK